MAVAGRGTGRCCVGRRLARRFYAIVTSNGQRELAVEPIDRRVTYYMVKAREVVEIWHKRRRRNGNANAAGEAAP
jgi:hypothetical protein